MDDLRTIRNIGIIAHIDAGKTSTTEAMLFYSGRTHRIGSIDDGTTVMDYLDEERERGITIIAAAAGFRWGEATIHLIDTPGHIDFTAEVQRSLRVIDGAVVIFSGVEGVEAQSEKVWRQADSYSVPKIAFINKLDRIGASFPRVVEEVREKFGQKELPIPLQHPVGVESDFEAILDLVSMELLRFSGDDHEQVIREAIPANLLEEAEEKRLEMIEALADVSDDIAMRFLEGEELGPESLAPAIRELTLTNRIVPVLLGSAKMRIGVQPLMDAAVAFLPAPTDLEPIPAFLVRNQTPTTVAPADPDAPFAGLIFKVQASTSADLLFLRVYSGTLKRDATLVNTRTGKKVRPKQVLRLYAKSTESVDEVGPGEIVGLIGPRDCGTGDTLCDPKNAIAFEKIEFPEAVIAMAIEPRFTKDKDKLSQSLELLCREDPTLHLSTQAETGQLILSGMGELHLEINMHRLLEEFRVEARVGEPRVAYRETFKAPTTTSVVFSKVLGENELYAAVTISFRPVGRGGEVFSVTNAVSKSKQMPGAFVEAAERALRDGLRTGGAHGYPLMYVAAEIRKIEIQPDKTTEGAVAGAVLMALDQAIQEVGTQVLEPLMHLEIVTPDNTVGEITNNLTPRRALIHEMIPVGTAKRLVCEVPLAEMFGFGKLLPKLSGGRATFSMEPCGYQELPEDVAKRVFGYL